MKLQTNRIATLVRAARITVFTTALCLGAVSVLAQTSAPNSSTAASGPVVPPPLKPSPKVTSPSDAQRSMDIDHAQPEGKVVPQIRIPLGQKTSSSPVFEKRRAQPAPTTAPNPLIGDDAARCEAQSSAQARAKCRDELAHQKK